MNLRIVGYALLSVAQIGSNLLEPAVTQRAVNNPSYVTLSTCLND